MKFRRNFWMWVYLVPVDENFVLAEYEKLSVLYKRSKVVKTL